MEQTRETKVIVIEQKSSQKKSYMHFCVQDYQKAPTHFLIPTRTEQSESDLPEHELKAVHGEGAPPDHHRPVAPNRRVLSAGWDLPYDCQMINVGYAERVAVWGSDPPAIYKSCVTNCDFDWTRDRRCREQLDVSPLLSPTEFKSTIFCYSDNTRKRFKNTVHYQPKLTPRNVTETCYLRAKRPVTTYTSLVDVRPPARRWYTSSVLVKPQTYSSNTVHNFKTLDGYQSDGSSVDEGIGEYSDVTSPGSGQETPSPTGIHIQTLSEGESNRSTVVVNGYVPGGSWNGYLSDTSDIAEV